MENTTERKLYNTEEDYDGKEIDDGNYIEQLASSIREAKSILTQERKILSIEENYNRIKTEEYYNCLE